MNIYRHISGIEAQDSGRTLGVVWCGVVWCGVVWCGVVWCADVGGRKELWGRLVNVYNGRLEFRSFRRALFHILTGQCEPFETDSPGKKR